MIHSDSLSQNATDIVRKCNSYFITKCERSLLQNVSGFLLQNGTALLPNVTVITNSDSATTIKFNIERLPQLDNTML